MALNLRNGGGEFYLIKDVAINFPVITDFLGHLSINLAHFEVVIESSGPPAA